MQTAWSGIESWSKIIICKIGDKCKTHESKNAKYENQNQNQQMNWNEKQKAHKKWKKTKIRQMFVLYNVWNINIHKGWKSFGHKKAAAHNNNKDKIFNKNKLGAERKSSAQIEDQQNMAKLLWHGG